MKRVSKKDFFSLVGYTPHPGQVQIHGALEQSFQHVVAVCGTRFGKTLAAAHEMAYEAVIPRPLTKINPRGEFMGWCVGPTHTLANLVFDAVAQILRTFLQGHAKVNKTDGVIEFQNLAGQRARIMRRTTQDAAGKGKLVGFAVDFMVVDEAASIRDSEIWHAQLKTRLLDRGGRSLHISSPRGVEGYFAEMFRSANSGKDQTIFAIQSPTWTNPYLPKGFVEKMRATMPERIFRADLGAELLANTGMVFSSDDLEKVFCLDFEDPIPNGDYFGGLDLAMTMDHTVLTIARAPLPHEKEQVPRVVYVERFYKLPIEVQIARIRETCDRYGDALINVDENGIGKPIYQLMANSGMNVRPVYTSAQGRNSKFDQVMNAAALIEKRAILLPRRDLLPTYFEEMSTYMWDQTPSGHLTANAPAGAHDDCVASFLLTTWHIRAAGSVGDGLVARAGRTNPERKNLTPGEVKEQPEMKIEGLAVPKAERSEDNILTFSQKRRGNVAQPRSLGKRLWNS